MSIESERLDRIEDHLKRLKDNDISQTDTLQEIKNALIGSTFNGNYGIVHQLSKMSNRLEILETDNSEIKVYIKQSKWIIGAIVVGLVTLIINWIQK